MTKIKDGCYFVVIIYLLFYLFIISIIITIFCHIKSFITFSIFIHLGVSIFLQELSQVHDLAVAQRDLDRLHKADLAEFDSVCTFCHFHGFNYSQIDRETR